MCLTLGVILYIVYYTLPSIPFPSIIFSFSLLSYSILLIYLLLFPSLFCSSSHFILYVSALGYTYLYSSILKIYLQFCSPLLFHSSPPFPSISSPNHPHSFYTCRYLLTVIYIPDQSTIRPRTN